MFWNVTNKIDWDLQAPNIKNGVEIFWIDGTYTWWGSIGSLTSTQQTILQCTWYHSSWDNHLEVVHNGTNYLFAVAMINSWNGSRNPVHIWIFAIKKSTWEVNVFYNNGSINWNTQLNWTIAIDDTLWRVKMWVDTSYTYYDFDTNTIWTVTWTYVPATTTTNVYNGKTYEQFRVERYNNYGSFTKLVIT
jgi:hypothetical protein